MKTVKEVSDLTGVSIRTLHYYDRIGLLRPTEVKASGYRLYDDTALERLQQILLFRELAFPLKQIKEILDSPGFDRKKALEQQIELLTLRKEHLEQLIAFAREIKLTGVRTMDFTVFDTKKLDEYAERAREQWGGTESYREFEEKHAKRSKEAETEAARGLMELLAEFGRLSQKAPSDDAVQKQVEKLRSYLTEHYYNCTIEILKELGEMYGAGGEFTDNINRYAGAGTAEFAAEAIAVYCKE